MPKINWSEKETNKTKILEHIGKKMALVHNLRKKTHRIANVLRVNCLLHDSIKGYAMEKKGIGRKMQFLD